MQLNVVQESVIQGKGIQLSILCLGYNSLYIYSSCFCCTFKLIRECVYIKSRFLHYASIYYLDGLIDPQIEYAIKLLLAYSISSIDFIYIAIKFNTAFIVIINVYSYTACYFWINDLHTGHKTNLGVSIVSVAIAMPQYSLQIEWLNFFY